MFKIGKNAATRHVSGLGYPWIAHVAGAWACSTGIPEEVEEPSFLGDLLDHKASGLETGIVRLGLILTKRRIAELGGALQYTRTPHLNLKSPTVKSAENYSTALTRKTDELSDKYFGSHPSRIPVAARAALRETIRREAKEWADTTAARAATIVRLEGGGCVTFLDAATLYTIASSLHYHAPGVRVYMTHGDPKGHTLLVQQGGKAKALLAAVNATSDAEILCTLRLVRA